MNIDQPFMPADYLSNFCEAHFKPTSESQKNSCTLALWPVVNLINSACVQQVEAADPEDVLKWETTCVGTSEIRNNISDTGHLNIGRSFPSENWKSRDQSWFGVFISPSCLTERVPTGDELSPARVMDGLGEHTPALLWSMGCRCKPHP